LDKYFSKVGLLLLLASSWQLEDQMKEREKKKTEKNGRVKKMVNILTDIQKRVRKG
jgi:hypothetical protein